MIAPNLDMAIGPDFLSRPVDLGDSLTPVDIWQSLHASERSWIARAGGKPRFVFSDQVDGSDRMLMQMLRPFPAARWSALCHGCGWTALGAIALSWCAGARLADVLDVIEGLGVFPQSGDAVERAASFLNPALLPENRMSALAAAAQGKRDRVLTLIAARPAAPEYDIEQRYSDLVPEIRALIESRTGSAGL